MSNQITMKKTLLYSAIALLTVISACHKTNNSTPTPVIPVTDSVTFAVNKVTGDTISTYTATKYGTFSFNIQAFQAKNGLTDQHLTVVYKAIDQPSATFQYAGKTVTGDTITTGLGYDVNYFPVPVKGNQRVSVSITDAAGRTFSDTITFYVKTYRPVPFTVSFNSLTWPNQTATSNFTLTITINSLSNTVGYWYEFTNYLTGPANITGTTNINDVNHSTFVAIKNPLSITNGYIEQVSFSLTGMSVGTYKLPLKVYDGNGDYKSDTLSFVVK